MSSSDFRVRPDDPEYQRLAALEAAHWQDVHPCGLESLEQTLAEGPSDFYTNRRFTGDPHRHWEETIREYGAFKRGLCLGTSAIDVEARILQTNPALHLTFIDVSEGALQRRCDLLGPRFPGRVDTQLGDLNFIELQESAFDLIVSCACIHHVTNLEHLAAQINRALTSGGYFFLQDYVGEQRFQLSDTKRQLYELVYARQAVREGRLPGVTWIPPDNLSPFCAVRSDEILDVFARHLDLQHLRTAGALTIAMMRSMPANPLPPPSLMRRLTARVERILRRLRRRRPQVLMDTRFLDELTLISDVLSDAGVINPGNAFAVYMKKNPA
jgi:SAM-dependent methyltransferase